MIRLTLERLVSNNDATLGLLHVDRQQGENGFERLHSVFTCEDEFRAVKKWGETRISCGVYWMGLRKEGGFHDRYVRKFGDWHHGMLQIMNVPKFEYILLHVGNSEKDTAGCILVGHGARSDTMSIQRSTAAYKEIYPPIVAALERGEDVSINISDRDRR